MTANWKSTCALTGQRMIEILCGIYRIPLLLMTKSCFTAHCCLSPAHPFGLPRHAHKIRWFAPPAKRQLIFSPSLKLQTPCVWVSTSLTSNMIYSMLYFFILPFVLFCSFYWFFFSFLSSDFFLVIWCSLLFYSHSFSLQMVAITRNSGNGLGHNFYASNDHWLCYCIRYMCDVRDLYIDISEEYVLDTTLS